MTRAAHRLTALAWLGLPLALGACLEPQPSPVQDTPPALADGERREVTLTFTRFEVENVEQRLTLEDLRELPRSVLDETLLTLGVRDAAIARDLGVIRHEGRSLSRAATAFIGALERHASER